MGSDSLRLSALCETENAVVSPLWALTTSADHGVWGAGGRGGSFDGIFTGVDMEVCYYDL